MTMMLASVRDRAEARLALEHGVDWLDVKDPGAGALGAASPATVGAVVTLAAGAVPVSATVGETWHTPELIPERAAAMAGCGVDFVKAGMAARELQQDALAAVTRAVRSGVRLIVVCMAERPPTASDIARLADAGVAGVMLDTAHKDGAALPGLMARPELRAFVAAAHRHHLLCGLAGRLRLADIGTLDTIGADYLGFRGALCGAEDRRGRLSAQAFDAVRAALSRTDVMPDDDANEVA